VTDTRPLLDALVAAGVGRGDLVGLAVAPGVGAGVAAGEATWAVIDGAGSRAVVDGLRAVEDELRPRWAVWSHDTVVPLVEGGLRLATSWDLAAVHRLLSGGWRAQPALVWAAAHDLALDALPAAGPLDLFSQAEAEEVAGDPDDPRRSDGHLDPEWAGGGWATSPDRVERWAGLALATARLQRSRLAGLAAERPRAAASARSESTAELLCAELAVDGLPMDRGVAEALVADVVGPRPRNEADAHRLRAERDDEVLRHAPGGPVDLRSPGQVKALLRRIGIEVPDTRAHRLEAHRDEHPLVEALLRWRKAERVATTYGYAWLDEHLAPDGRLRGAWTGSDGAAGRMTASAGLHNMPADMRAAVVAGPGHVFVRADLGQIEPRVLAAVSGDRALARASQADDLYLPLADHLGVDRATAKVAMLGAMYGQTSGHGAHVMGRLRSTYPVATAYLESGDRSGRLGRDVCTYGGRLVRMGGAAGDHELDDRAARSRSAARGRYGRNALVQGAAAELFKVWAVTVRARARDAGHGARIVLCLHDELLVHVPEAGGAATAALVEECLREAAERWAPRSGVRFVADVGVIARWSDAKD
jgi:DNA polymerase-1